MTPIAAGSPFRRPRSRSRGPTPRSPSPPPLPPKSYIDLNSSTRSSEPEDIQGPTRAYLCDVVVVGPENNETTALLRQLGEVVERPTAIPRPAKAQTSTLSTHENDEGSVDSASKQEELDKRLRALIEELVRTERSYVSRIKALKTSYADPLRHFAKSSSTSIIPVYEAKTLFGNIDVVLPAALVFLAELERMWESGQAEQIIGDVCLEHLKMLKTLDPYRTYIANQDEAQRTYQEMFRKHPRFVSFTDSTKYQTTGIGNIGLRELLMEPVQRVPRYTLLWQSMAKCMSVLSPQRTKLLEAKDIASHIARCEADEQTVRATVMYCLQRNVEGFPASLFSNNRNYLDSIDAEDVTTDGVIYNPRASRPMSIKSGKSSTVTSIGSLATSNGSFASPQKEMGAPPPLHCTLFLFDDKLMITKRQVAAISGRRATGLDDINDLIKSGGGVAIKEKDGSKKAKLSFRGVVDILDVRVADMGNGDFQLYFEKPISDQGERWTLPLRSFTVCHPPATVGLDSQAARLDKQRFVQNIWAAQALARTKLLPSQVKAIPHVLSKEKPFKVDGGRVKAFWNVWTSAGWASEQRQAKIVIQVVGREDYADVPLPEPIEPTVLIIRLEPMAGEICRFSYVSVKSDVADPSMLRSSEVNQRMVDLISEKRVYVLPSNNPNPMMQTPTLSKRASRMLFGSYTASSRGGGHSSGTEGYGSTSTHRSRSITSRSSAMDIGGFSGGDTISSSGHSLAQASPGSPRSPRSPCTPSSPIWSPARSENGHGLPSPVNMEGFVRGDLDARLDEARLNSRSLAALASPRRPANPPTPATPSRVTAMREQVEARERQAKQEAEELLAKARSPSPLKIGMPSPGAGAVSRRAPVPTLASSVRPTTEGSSRDSSLSSLPQSPSKSTLMRGGTLARAGTQSPRGPRNPPGRSGYVPPLPPPTPSAESQLGKSPLGPTSLHLPASESESVSAAPTTIDISPTEDEARALSPSPPNLAATETVVSRRPLPIPQPLAPPVVPSRLMGLGTAPKLRSTSGRSRKSDPLTANDENVSPTTAQKRQHPAEHLSPRKRTPSDSPMSRREGDMTPTQSHTPRYPSGLGAAPSRPGSVQSGSGSASNRVITPRGEKRRSSGALTPSRRVSSIASVTSTTSTASVATVCTLSSAIDQCDVVMSDHPDLASAADAARQRIGDARKQARTVRKNIAALNKQLKEPSRRNRGLDHHGSIARSPHSRNIHAELMSTDDLSGLLTGVPSGKADFATEDSVKLIASASESLESQLVQALADTERVRMLARRATEQTDLVAQLEAQVLRAMEREDLLRNQLASKDIEVDEIYNAFNMELDGMYNDISLATPDEVQAALRNDLRNAKASRNDLALENQRLRDELAKERLKREQMAGVLRSQGTAMSAVGGHDDE